MNSPSDHELHERRLGVDHVLRSVVVICTKDRDALVEEVCEAVLALLASTTIMVVDASRDERTRDRCVALADRHRDAAILYRPARRPGLARQRNQALEECAELDVDVVHFIDDDTEPLPGYFGAIEERFVAEPDVGGVGGCVQNQPNEEHPIFNRCFLLSGRYPNTIRKSGRVVTPQSEGGAMRVTGVRPVTWLQGFSMSYRLSTLRGATFDERLSGYSYGEDRDFSFRLSRSVRLCVEPRAQCLHHRATENRLSSRHLAFESTVLVYAWVRERRIDGFSRLAFFWSVLGDIIRHLASAALQRDGIEDTDPMDYVAGVLQGLVTLATTRGSLYQVVYG